ncbi:LysM peptidoglycan-binding domain-containing protein [Tumebacillus algifaecis]|nr:LysM peptidoglycan-binding domain-containing protein [Tumebacillus algifaecis]
MSKEGATTVHLYHTKAGDTLEGIAIRHRVTPDVLRICNGLPPSPFLLPGHTLLIPSQLTLTDKAGYQTYRVQEGDTLRSISERTGVPLTLISLSNGLGDELVSTGDILQIPDLQPRSTQPKKQLGLFSMTPLPLPTGAHCPLTYQGTHDLRIDAAGNLHLPPLATAREQTARQLFLCTLDGAPQILPDVAKAIVKSEEAKLRILDQLAMRLGPAGGDGIIFDWPAMRRENEVAYLQLVKEAGRRLRPMGYVVGLYLNASSPLCKRTSLLADVCRQLDHLFFEPITSDRKKRSLLSPLVGIEETRQAMQKAVECLPPEKIWLVLRPAAVYASQGRAVVKLAPHTAMQLAYEHGSPLMRDSATDLAWFRCPNREGGHSVWFDDVKSFVGKLEMLEHMKLQGIALWEVGAYFPDAWQYLYEMYETRFEPDPR